MAVTSPSKRCKGDSPANWLISFSIQLKCPMRKVIESQGLEDQVCTYKCPDYTPDQWNVLNIVERVGPSSLSRNFSNGTSTMDIDDRYFNDPDSDDEANNHLSSVGRSHLRS
ncbi:hypothetical protein Fot_22591 [Forsythia ovata]|uniref:Uncharacterized protein n=1 Tax=Forsythia ovata TaxID=205694 RepID=A0ABD1UY75_9LAMI